ncbi:MAG TPA: DNA alkylation repair protein [Vicinamibacteria bacterium]|nr:DNA alkylation repair protein [Vicinamibacteria bacterium]
MKKTAAPPTAKDVLAWLERTGTARQRDEMKRYGIVARRAFGVPVGTLKKQGKRLGPDHALAAALWKSGWYEARLLAGMVDDPERVTPRQMDAWAAAFDSWAVCDTVCFHLFDRTPFAWEKARAWAASPREFVKRAGFVMMAGQVGRDKAAPDGRFLTLLPLIEKGARDDRPFVKKGVSWALRRIGRRNRALHAACLALARRLAASEVPSARWVGKDALRELTSAKVLAQLARRRP